MLPVPLSAPVACSGSLPSSAGVNAAVGETYCARTENKSGSESGKNQNKQICKYLSEALLPGE